MKNKIILYSVIGVLIFVIYPYIKEYRDLKDKQKTAPVLLENEHEKIIVEHGRVTHVTESGVKINPASRKTVVTVKKDGKIEVYSPTWGFINEFGLASFYSTNRLYLGIDTQFFYWKTFGFTAGAGISPNTPRKYRFYAAGSKILPFKRFNNTSIFIGVDHDLDIIGGLRVRF